MARLPRQLSYTDTYHIIIRGINRENIFLDNQDRKKFLKILEDIKEEYHYEIYAFCLMDNHVHLLLKDNNKKLSKIMQSLTIRYSMYFNKKYERVGHLFQNRFISKCVETEKYLLTVQKYIHQNPEIARISKTERYLWSSITEYIKTAKICNTQFILRLFSTPSLKNFLEFTLTQNKDLKEFTEIDGTSYLTDEEAIRIIKDIIKQENVRKILEYNKVKRDEEIIRIKECNIISNVQIARILGVNRKIIERAKR